MLLVSPLITLPWAEFSGLKKKIAFLSRCAITDDMIETFSYFRLYLTGSILLGRGGKSFLRRPTWAAQYVGTFTSIWLFSAIVCELGECWLAISVECHIKALLAAGGCPRWLTLDCCISERLHLLWMCERLEIFFFAEDFHYRARIAQLPSEQNNQENTVVCDEDQMEARQWVAKIRCCCPHFVMCSSFNKKNKASFFHMHIKFGYSFVAALIFLGEERKSEAETFFFSPKVSRKSLMCFSDVELFQLHAKEATGFVILCWTKITLKVKGETCSWEVWSYLQDRKVYID